MSRSDSISDLRAKAEKIIRETPENIHHVPAEDLRDIIHELHVHQVELELQNEELRNAQRISEETQRKYFDLYDLAPVGYFTLDKNGRILEVNLAGADSLEIERARLLSRLFVQFITPESRGIFLSHRDKCLETRKKHTCELKMQPAGGAVFHVLVEMIADEDEKEAVLKLTLSDIDQLKKVEARQRLTIEILSEINQTDETEDMLRNILLSIKAFSGMDSVGVRLRQGEDYPYVFTNGFSADFTQTANRLCATDADGNIIRDADGHPILEGLCGKVIRGGSNRLHPFFTPNGSFRTNSTSQFISAAEKIRYPGARNHCNREGYESLALIPLRSGKDVIGLLQLADHRRDMFDPDIMRFFEDIATSISIALRSKQLIEEKEQLAEDLHFYRKNKALSTLAGGIAHDFNNMLSIIMGNAELAIEDSCNWSSIYDYLAEIKRTSVRAGNTIRQIMTFAQYCGEMKVVMNLDPIIRKSLNALVPETIRVEYACSADNDAVFSSPSQIHQVLLHLISNAADAMKEKGSLLTLELRNETLERPAGFRISHPRPGMYAKLSVSDTGTGIDPEITDRIFDPYFTTKDIGEGSGLGLSVVQGIVSSLKGRITVESRPGRGTTFHIWIPLAKEGPAPALR